MDFVLGTLHNEVEHVVGRIVADERAGILLRPVGAGRGYADLFHRIRHTCTIIATADHKLKIRSPRYDNKPLLEYLREESALDFTSIHLYNPVIDRYLAATRQAEVRYSPPRHSFA